MASDTSSAPVVMLPPAVHTGFRLFALVVLVLMAASVGYAAWIVLLNWSAIGV